ncbi:nuclease-like protein [Methylophaga frappieri]|uniref:Nuclease-like protein n=2 Tax=Methylophaga frappieri (strain ATCC BAA-2434 / DSM 25690 / JAM7) TaxID=754477 RepID=I1YGE8_METFJ|nr:nuclease-like protein [Methylophaga frappieri]
MGLTPLASADLFTGKVVSITDGDTIKLLTPEKELLRVRLTGIDAPERKQPYFNRSKQILSDLCFDKPAAVDSLGRDRYQRVLGRVTCDGVDANAYMVFQGVAWVYTKYNTDSSLVEYQSKAQAARKGLWQEPNPVPPWEWRRK